MGVGAQVAAVGLVVGVAVFLGLIAMGMFPSSSSAPLPTVVRFRLVDPSVGPDGIASQQTLSVEVEVAADPEIEPAPAQWLITEGSIPEPSLDNPGWMSTPPGSYTLSAGDGPKSVNLWVQDPQDGILHASEYLVLLDTTIPLDPVDAFSLTHQIGETSDNNRVIAQWSPALDPAPGSGIAGYSIDWSRFPNTVPDPIQDLDGTVVAATSPALSVGTWYMHLSTLDRAGNHTTTVHLGPFIIGDSTDGSGVAVSPSGAGDSSGGSSSSGEGAPGPEDVVVDLPQPLVDPPVVDDIEVIPEIVADPVVDDLPTNPPEPAVEGGTGDSGGNSGSSESDDDDDGGAAVVFLPSPIPAPFQPAIGLVIGGNAVSAIGETVTYQAEIANTSSSDTPALILDSLTDDLLGDLTASAIAANCGTLLAGTSCAFSVDRVVQSGDADPVSNNGAVTYHVQGFSDTVGGSDSHSVELFQPAVAVTVGGSATAQVGDSVTYQYAVTNTGSGDSPNLVLDSIIDDLLGDLNIDASAAGCADLASGDSCAFDVIRQVDASDPDPLVNAVSVHYHPQGFANDVTGSDSHSVELFQPAVGVTVGGSATAQVGDSVTYQYAVTNTGSGDSPNLVLDSIIDDLLGDLNIDASAAGCADLASGDSCAFDVIRQVDANDPDPLVNEVSVHYHPQGFANDVTSSDSHSVELFQPAVAVTVGGDTTAQVGDSVTYQYTVTNTGSGDSPNLVLDSIIDDLLVDLIIDASAAGCADLASGDSCAFDVNRQVDASDPDPLVNEVSVHYHPQGFANDVTGSDSHSVVIVVSPGNTPPNAADDLGIYSVDENSTLTVPQLAGVLANDTDPDGDPLTAVHLNGPNNGVLTLNADGSLGYTPDLNFNGVDSFKYRANDGIASSGAVDVDIIVLPINQSPIADSSSVTTDQDTPVALVLTGSDGETAAGDLGFSILLPPATGTLSGLAPDLIYTPDAGFVGSDSFTFTVTDRGDPDNCGTPATGCAAAQTSLVATVSIQVFTVSSGLIQNLVINSPRQNEIDILNVGGRVYTDRGFEYTDVPANLAGNEFIRTANSDKNLTNADYISFGLSEDARVFILFDHRATVLPAWLDDGTWQLVIYTVDTSDVLRRVYFKDFSPGTVQLGGNAAAPMSGAGSNYNVVVVPANSLSPDTTAPIVSIIYPTDGHTLVASTVTVTGDSSDDTQVTQVEISVNGGSFETAGGTISWSKDVTLQLGSNTITARATDLSGNAAEVSATVTYQPPIIANVVVANGKTYEVDTLETDKRVYTDRGYTFNQVPALLAGKDFIRTSNNDKTETAADFITFELTGDARVYILFDDRVSILPAWLDDVAWTLDNTITQETTDVLRRVYYQDFLVGPVQLGGNAMAPMSGAGSNYNVVVAASIP